MRRNLDNHPSVESSKLSVYRQILNFVIGWIGLQLTALIVELFIVLGNNIIYKLTGTSLFTSLGLNMAVNSIAYLILFGTILAVDNKQIIKLFKTKNVGLSIAVGVVGFITIYIFDIAYSNIIALFRINMSNNANETSLDSVISVYPLISIFIFGIIGPLTEELTYRVGLFSLIKRWGKVPAYIITIIVFTLIHFDFSAILVIFQGGKPASLVNEILNIPLYAFAALIFTLIFDGHGFIGSSTAHIANNLFSIIAQIILERLV